jgi:hypothetical protein
VTFFAHWILSEPCAFMMRRRAWTFRPSPPTDSSSSRCHRPSSRPCSRVAALKPPPRSEQRSRAPGPTQTTSASSAAPRSCGAIRTPSGGSYRALVRREPERVMAGHARFHGEPGGPRAPAASPRRVLPDALVTDVKHCSDGSASMSWGSTQACEVPQPAAGRSRAAMPRTVVRP